MTSYLREDFQSTKCPKCKLVAVHIISLTDDGKGQKVCIDCKQEIRKKHPEKDFRFASEQNKI